MRFAKAEPTWLTLIPHPSGDEKLAVRAKFAPPSRSMKRRAARAALVAAGGAFPEGPISDDQLDALYDAGEASSFVLIKLALLEMPEGHEPEWQNVEGADGKALAVTEENVEIVLANEEFFDAADALYVRPIADRDREKNASAASPNGIGGAVTQGKAIASSSAPATPRSRATPKAAATPAPTPKTRPKRPRAKKSSTS